MDKNVIQKMRQAIAQDDIDTVKMLMSENDDWMDVETATGSFLHDASKLGMYDIVCILVEEGMDVNKKGGMADLTPVVEAAFSGKLKIIDYLYNHGANIYDEDFESNPLFAAIYNNHFEVVKYLVDKGIDTKVTYSIGDIEECDAYEYARQYGRTEIAEYLKALR